jgi:hypothetical protein
MIGDIMLNKDFKNLKNILKYKLFFQVEHNLVLKEGRSVDKNNLLFGNIKSIYNDDNYLVRIIDLEKYNNYDYIIEYSLLNIENIKRSNLFDHIFLNKILYLPPFIYTIDFNFNKNRDIQLLTTYINEEEPRRKHMFYLLNSNNICYINKNNIFNKYKLCEIYDNTKILINIHQTDHHHTLEEFRILPALSRGVIIISEIIPLKEIIPYHNYIIWTTYDNILETIQKTIQKYDYYHNKFFREDSNLNNILHNLNNNSINNIKKILNS